MSFKRLIGDVHGHYQRYKRIIKGAPPSVQIGDMGVGFRRWPHGEFMTNPPFDRMVENDARFIRGNHDSYSVCRRHKQWIPDGTVENDIMYIGGAVSIDRQYRIEGYSWWADEEPSIEELCQMVDVYKISRPRLMITHECPEMVVTTICSYRGGYEKIYDGSRCRQAFQSMAEIHQPQLWVHGHWHLSFDKVINGTRYICLNELEWIDIDLDTLEIVKRGQG